MPLKNLIRICIYLIIILCGLNIVQSNDLNLSKEMIYITEINFLNDEFIEIYSNLELDFSRAKFIDSSIDKIYELELIKKANSSLYIILGSDNNYNLSELNCNVVISKSSKLGYYGLKNSGESFSIINLSLANNTNLGLFNLSYIDNSENIKNSNEFENNWTLNYDFNINKYYYHNITLGKLNEIQINSLIINNSNEYNNYNNINEDNSNYSYEFKFNESFENSSYNKSNLNLDNNFDFERYFFNILFDSIVFNKTFKFRFNSNLNNSIINYYILNDNGNIIRNKTSESFGVKYFSPNDMTPQTYIVYANICSKSMDLCLNNKTKIYYFPELNYEINELSKKSNITILNLKDLTSLKSNILELEIYRNLTNKRVINVYLNNKKISSIMPEKDSRIKLNIELEYNYNLTENLLIISGLDNEIELIIPTKFEEFNSNSINNVSKVDLIRYENKDEINEIKSKPSINLYEFNNLNNSEINFIINSTFDELNFETYILNRKTKITDVLSGLIHNGESKFNLKINKSKFDISMLKNNKSDLKLIFKYKKPNNKYFLYISKSFNQTNNFLNMSNSFKNSSKLLNQDNLNNSLNSNIYKQNYSSKFYNIKNIKDNIKDNAHINIENSNYDKGIDFNNIYEYNENPPFSYNSPRDISYFSSNNLLNYDENKIEFKSKSETLKENSTLFISLGSILLLIPMIIFW